MFLRRRSTFRSRSYEERQAEAAGEGCDAETARAFAGGSRSLRQFLRSTEEDDQPDEEESES